MGEVKEEVMMDERKEYLAISQLIRPIYQTYLYSVVPVCLHLLDPTFPITGK